MTQTVAATSNAVDRDAGKEHIRTTDLNICYVRTSGNNANSLGLKSADWE